jgi:hypothetical protein
MTTYIGLLCTGSTVFGSGHVTKISFGGTDQTMIDRVGCTEYVNGDTQVKEKAVHGFGPITRYKLKRW